MKANCIKFQPVEPEIYLIVLFLEKSLGLVFRPHFFLGYIL